MLVNLVPSASAAIDFATASLARPRPEKKPAPVAPDVIDPVARTQISLEYASLQYKDHCPLGMYVVPSPETLMVWDAVFFVHQGYYADAIFKFRLTFPNNYPEAPPVVQFMTDVVFHPLISHTGIFNLAPRFRPWRPKEHRVFDVLHWIKTAFKKHALDEIKESDCLNKEAYRYHESTSSFAGLASQSSLLSQSAPALFDRDHPSMKGKPRDAMPFRELPPEQLQLQRKKIGLQECAEDKEHP
ncbi:UBC-like protein [Mycena maculata]|uniref:UBC-like protein n=1 Tax=Mycena maculata TaxID=230809 RepID=A0AAD7N3W7_9AGAR|nr:UBC-like protein [Mycena maculata]